MNTVKAFRGMASGYEVAVGREAGSAVERGGGTIRGKAAVARVISLVGRIVGSLVCQFPNLSFLFFRQCWIVRDNSLFRH